jgi:hypothetical protein
LDLSNSNDESNGLSGRPQKWEMMRLQSVVALEIDPLYINQQKDFDKMPKASPELSDLMQSNVKKFAAPQHHKRDHKNCKDESTPPKKTASSSMCTIL